MNALLLSSPYVRGANVKKAQKRLTASGYYGGAIDGIYGPVTASATKSAKWKLGYQRQNVNQAYDQGLDDFLSGARKTNALMRQRAKSRLKKLAQSTNVGAQAADRMVDWYRLGWKESPSGSNRVPQLQDFCKSLGLKPYYHQMGFAWCALAVFSSALSYGSKAAKAGLFEERFNALFTPTIRQMAASTQFWMKQVSVKQVSKGTALLFDFGGSNGQEVDHIGYALGAAGEAITVGDEIFKPRKTEVVTVEGNTSYDDKGSQSNGGCVAVKIRKLSEIRAAFEIA